MTKRNSFLVLILSLITGGIYTLYWLHATRREITRMLGNEKTIWPIWVMFAPSLALFTIFILYITVVVSMVAQNKTTLSDGPIMNILLFLVGAAAIITFFVVPIMWMHKFCKALSAATGRGDSTTLYVVWILLSIFGVGFVWSLLAQNDINTFVDAQTAIPAYPTV